ncbi:acyltransferase family protein [Mucilaginibacter sp.]
MKERFKTLDIFRGIFSSFVIFFHMTAFSATPIINNSFFYNAYLFVDFFFVLSGFVIAYTYQSIDSWPAFSKFYKKRFFRLYPLHVIVLLLFLAINLVKHHASGYVHVNQLGYGTDNWRSFLTNLFLLNSVKMPAIHDVSWNIASWSISAEMIAYLVFGLVVTFINTKKLQAFKLYIYLIIAVSAFLVMAVLTHSFNINNTFDYGFLRGVMGFFSGVLCFNLYRFIKGKYTAFKPLAFNILEPACLVVIAVLICFGEVLKSFNFIFDTFFFITILVFAFEKGGVSAMLNKSVLLHNMGKYSYSIYMIHTLLLSLFNVVFIRLLKLPASAYWYLFIINYLIIYVVSAWTYKHIEMRFSLKPNPNKKSAWWIW